MAVLAIQQQVELERQASRDRQRTLVSAEPVAQRLDRHLAVEQQARARIAAPLGDDPPAYLAAQHPGLHRRGAQALGQVETEVALHFAHIQLRTGHLQGRAHGGEIHDHPGLAGLVVVQRNIQLQVALQGPIALPAGEDLAGRDRRFLEQLDAVLQVTVDGPIHIQVRRLSRTAEGNVDLDVADPGIQQIPAGGQHADSGILDEHLADRFAQGGPAGLVGQLAVADLEVEVHDVGFGRRAAIQRALPLEVALLDMATADRRLQPVRQAFVHSRQLGRQVLGGEARVAVAEADLQVHVVFSAGIAHQADQHVAGQAALLALDPHQVAAEGEGAVVQAPEHPRAGLAVAPRLGKHLGQVQHEILRRCVELASSQGAGQGAADIFHCRNLMERRDTDLFQVGRVADPLGHLSLRPEIGVQVVQDALRLQARHPLRRRVRQRRQRFYRRHQGRQVDAVGLQLPVWLVVLLVATQQQLHLAPALLAEIRRQVADPNLPALRFAIEEQVHAQVVDFHRLARGIRRLQLRRQQPCHQPLRLAVAPVEPEVAAGLGPDDLPFLGQTGRQPLRPVALRQAEIEPGAAARPVLAVDPPFGVQRQGLAIRQLQAGIETLPTDR